MLRKQYLEQYGKIWSDAKINYLQAAGDLERLNKQAKDEAAAEIHGQVLPLEVEKRAEALAAYYTR